MLLQTSHFVLHRFERWVCLQGRASHLLLEVKGVGLQFFFAEHASDLQVPIDCFNEPWVIFRGQDGKAGCIRDECAHRACPLSLGTLVDGKVQCPYHGELTLPTTPPKKGASNLLLFVQNAYSQSVLAFLWFHHSCSCQPKYDIH